MREQFFSSNSFVELSVRQGIPTGPEPSSLEKWMRERMDRQPMRTNDEDFHRTRNRTESGKSVTKENKANLLAEKTGNM